MEWIELGKLGKVTTGNTPSKKKIEYYNENYIELVKPSNFIENAIVNIESGEEHLSKEGKSKGKVAEVGDILVTCIGSIGNVGIASKEVCFNQQINGIKVDKNKALSKYIAYAILYIKPALNHVANKAVVPIINKSTFEKIKIPVPPIEIQKQIVDVLDEAQKLIDNRKKQIKLLDNLIESIFYDMFGDPVKNDKGWEVKKLEEFYYVRTGKTPKRGVAEYWNNPRINWIKTGEILNGVINSSEEKISRIAKEELNMYLFSEGDILIAMYGQGNTRGRVAKLNIRSTTNQACAGLVKKEDSIINNEYTYNILLLLYEQLRDLGRGGNQPNLNLGMIREYEIPIPPLPLQNQFAEKVQAIEKQKELFKQSLKLLEDNYNSLMQRAFKGELF